MLNLRSFAKWVRGILDSEEAYNLPEDVYNDVIPSGVHDFCRFDREYEDGTVSFSTIGPAHGNGAQKDAALTGIYHE